MNQAQAYHFVGLDIHKRTVAFCEKTAPTFPNRLSL